MLIDRLYQEVEQHGPICVGLDTDVSYIPESYFDQGTYQAIVKFNKEIIDATSDLTAIYKLQIAYYEKQGLEGLKAYKQTLAYLREKNKLTIGDIKRGDIAKTAEAYAQAHFSGDFEVDFVTLSPYMGFDSIDPYLPYLDQEDKGIFVLVRTSNPGSKDIQDISDGKMVYEQMAEFLNLIGKSRRGDNGYSNVGAVVGGTSQEELAKIRELLPNTYFLIPGYGAQGARADDVKRGLIDNNGAIINASRSIITAHQKADSEDVGYHARQAALKMSKEFNEQ